MSNDDWIIFNKQQTGFYRVWYDEENYKLINAELNSGDPNRIHALNRAQLVDDTSDFVITGRLPPETFFSLITYLRRETHFGPWISAKRAFDEIDNVLDGSNKQEVFHSFVAALTEPNYRKLGLNFPKNESYSNKYLRKIIAELACNYGVKSCLDETRRQFQDYLHGRKVLSPNSRSLVFVHGIRNADERQVKALWERFERSKNDEERKEIVSSIGNVKNETIRKLYLTKSLQTADVREFTKTERQALIQSVACGSQFGLDSVVQLLINNMEKAKNQIDDVDILLKQLAEQIVTTKTHSEVSSNYYL